MKLYIAPGACSLADHIALHEAGFDFGRVMVDLKTKRTDDGRDYMQINPKGYVPALQFDDGQVLTENIAILSWVADQDPSLAPSGPMGRYRLLEMLAFISTEIHKGYKPFFRPDASDAEKAMAGETIAKRLAYLAGNLKDDYLFGDRPGVADAYLFVMTLWAQKVGLTLPDPLPAFVARMKARPAVRLALEHEGLAEPANS
ncbi:MAG: glutathione S-transferase domain protein [Phenylobacterium sp.]|jgi:glutathione S-transferase|nr:glutathione S-transferase domain protein [Phenylobacterium sp.]MDB5435470.1 glutathione S-transferase domain protein [Phenylobacterium sp.]MDB5461837.1 glutathione S-transferase domain protein [Phenylobacterium sp.]